MLAGYIAKLIIRTSSEAMSNGNSMLVKFMLCYRPKLGCCPTKYEFESTLFSQILYLLNILIKCCDQVLCSNIFDIFFGL